MSRIDPLSLALGVVVGAVVVPRVVAAVAMRRSK